jgi:hypothetical protein
MFKFDLVKTVPMVLLSHGLEATRKVCSIKISESLDGATITKNVNMTATGIKISDPQARCPFTKQLLIDETTPGKLQSHNNCFPLQVLTGSRNKRNISGLPWHVGIF